MPLNITIPGREFFNEKTEEFIEGKEQKLCLEHSLVSISKWESKWLKPYFDDKNKKTEEETLDYIRCMTITQNVDPIVYNFLTSENIKEIVSYIDSPSTATWFGKGSQKPSGKRIITSELIYCWMIQLNIPMECQRWHINRLFTLIRVCSEENKPPKKRSKREVMSRNAALNAARREKLNTRG